MEEKKKKVKKISEASLQISCVKWFRLQYPDIGFLLFSVPNGGFRNAIEASNLKRQGVVSGVSDLILLIPDKDIGGVLCLELKVGRNNQTELQEQWESMAVKYGNTYVVIRSLEEFIDVVEKYLKKNL